MNQAVKAPHTLNRDDWPPNYTSVFMWRQQQVLRLRNDPVLRFGAKEFYRTHPVEFINHWVDTYDPRKSGSELPARIPLICFERQDELIQFLQSCIDDQEGGLIEKARDMGASWICCAFTVWLFLFCPGASIGWGSRKEQLVDRIGDADSLFEKMRMIIRGLPSFFLPAGFDPKKHMSYMKFINPENGATITGEAGPNIGRGGRKLIYFKDESAHYEQPESIEAALGDNTNVPIDISSVNGVGNVFHRKRESGQEWALGKIMEKGRTRVFIMDWSHHPAKTQEWYDTRKAKAESEGLQHIFAQEVQRNYSAAVQGIIIPADWVNAAVDAHIKLGLEITGGACAGLDVADEEKDGSDKNALALRKGVLLTHVEDWGSRDIAEATRKAVGLCEGVGDVAVQYDCIGVGAGVKAEANNLIAEGVMPINIQLVAWSAAAGPLNPEQRLIPDDDETPLNKDYYENLKAQAWWELRQKFWRTYQWVVKGVACNPDDIISIDSKIANIHQLKKELSQPVMTKSRRMKQMVDKKPDGTKSPNLADAVAMCYWPVENFQPVGILVKKRHR